MNYSVEKFVDNLIINGKCKEEEKDIILYGLKMGIEILFNLLTTIVLSLLFGMVFETIIFTIVFFFLRSNCGGIHAQNGRQCYIFSTIMLITVLSVQALGVWKAGINYMAFCIGVVLILFIAPLGDKNKPLDELEKKHYRKKTYQILTIIFIVFVLSSILKINILSTNISLAILVVSVSLVLGKIKNNLDERNQCD